MIKGAAILVLIAALCAGGTWLVVGSPDRSVPCDPATLKKNYVCLETVRTDWKDQSIIWIDARPPDQWKKNGLPEAFCFTDGKGADWDELEQEFTTRFQEEIINASIDHLVVYCNTQTCGSSDRVADHLRELFGDPLGFQVWVLHGGWKALAAEGNLR